jgi:hypothetical protein
MQMTTIDTISPVVVRDFIPQDTVRGLIKGRGTRIATITFLKADGSERVANGLFRPSSHIIGSERGFKQSEHMKAIGLQPFYDLQKKAWISFYLDRVLTVK